MTTLNAIYRPKPENFSPEEIPEWESSFVEKMSPQLTLRLAFNPAGEGVPTIGDLSGCDPLLCEELNEGEIKELWRSYYAKNGGLDGLFKMRNPFGDFDTYFFRHGIHHFDEYLCKSGMEPLPVSLTRGEAVVLEIWTNLHRTNFQACDIDGETGEFFYTADVNNENLRDRLRDSLDRLIEALEWEGIGEEGKENPYNPARLPMDISLEKVNQLSWSLWKDHWKERLVWAGGAAVGLTVPFWLGIGFHYGPVLAGKALRFFGLSVNSLPPLFFFPGQKKFLYPDDRLKNGIL